MNDDTTKSFAVGGVPEDDVRGLLEILKKLPSGDLGELMSMLKVNPQLLSALIANVKIKRQAIKDKDADLWRKIILSEKELIEKITG